jgi:hypothetical protein
MHITTNNTPIGPYPTGSKSPPQNNISNTRKGLDKHDEEV